MEDRPKKRDRLFSQLKEFYPEVKPKLFNAISTRHLKNHHIGCALSHRAVIQEAQNEKYKNVLVFEEDAVLHKKFDNLLEENINDLSGVDWDILYLGACIWERKPPKPPREFELVEGCKRLKVLTGATCTQALAYNFSCFDYILDSLPDNINDMQKWCKKHSAIDQWFMYFMQGRASVRDGFRKFKCYITEPRICSQPFLTGKNKQDKPEDFLSLIHLLT